jgi:probable HAF family extracellular repeat protein
MLQRFDGSNTRHGYPTMAISRHQPSFRLIRTVCVLASLLICGVQMPAQSPSPLPYAVRDFGLTTGTNSAAYDVGEYGQYIVGRSRSQSGAYHGFVDGYFGRFDVGTLGGGDSTAFGVYSGLVVGQAQLPSGEYRAFAYDVFSETMSNLGTLGGNWSAAYSVVPGFVVGASRLAGSARLQAFSHANGVMSAVPVDRGGDSVARGVNGSGDVVGYACTTGNARCRGFISSASGIVDLGPANANSVANAINENNRQVVGALGVGSATHAFLYDNGTTTDLGTLGGASSEALAISEQGHVVGWSHVAGGAEHAFLWRNGSMIDLNSLLPPNSGWVLQQAKAISDGGQIVGYGTFGGVRRAFLLTPPTDLRLYPFGVKSQEDSNLPRGGVEVGTTIPFVTSIVADSPSVTIYGAKTVHTLTGPAVFVQGRTLGPGFEFKPCQVTATMVTCDIPPLDSPGTGHEAWVRVRATGTGVITHTARLVTDVSDPNTSNNRIVEENRAVALASFTIAPATVAAGSLATATIGLTGTPPAGDAIVRLTSSRPDIVSLPATFDVLPWWEVGQFHIVPNPVSAPTPVQITASYGLVPITRTLTVVPTGLRQLYLTPTTVIGGCGTSSGRILLSGAAPAGGAAVPLSNTNPRAAVPATVTVPAGSNSVTFTVPTTAVTANTSGTVTASYGGVSQSLALTVRPIRASGLVLSPNPASGGTTVSGTVSLECPAAPGNVVVTLRTSNAAVAAPVTSTVTVPAGATSATFAVNTFGVTASTPVSIEAWVFGVRRSATLTVIP